MREWAGAPHCHTRHPAPPPPRTLSVGLLRVLREDAFLTDINVPVTLSESCPGVSSRPGPIRWCPNCSEPSVPPYGPQAHHAPCLACWRNVGDPVFRGFRLSPRPAETADGVPREHCDPWGPAKRCRALPCRFRAKLIFRPIVSGIVKTLFFMMLSSKPTSKRYKVIGLELRTFLHL